MERKKKIHKNRKLAAKYLLITGSALFMILPFLWMLSASFKDTMDVFTFPIKWIPKVIKYDNYAYIWNQSNYPILFLNTLKLAAIITTLQIITCSLAAYAFCKIDFPERNKLFFVYLIALMVPFQVIMIPQFQIVRILNLSNTHLALILIQAFNPMGVFMLKQFFIGIPNELSEAARIDGLNEFGIYKKIIMPLSKPIIATLTIVTSVTVWNDFLAPLIYINSSKLYTIQIGLRNMISEFTADYAPIMAASVISILPVVLLFLVFQRFFEDGVATTGLKG